MESNSWTRFTAASKRHQSTLQSRFDLYLGFDDVDGGGEDDLRAEFACPFCAEDFDIVGLCCHIDEEHPVEAKNGVCPVCAARVGMDMVSHITTQHGNFFKISFHLYQNAFVSFPFFYFIKFGCSELLPVCLMFYLDNNLHPLIKSYMQRRRRFRRGSSGSHSTLSLLRKELREGNLQSLFGGSSLPSNAAPDPLLSSFITNLPVSDPSRGGGLETLDDGNVVNEASEEKATESIQPVLSDKEQEERAQKSEFLQGLVLSTIFDVL
ncbi:uncharacterized protein A4U43_C02F21620 [Asparagus officinalis]|uniref:Drought induced 19 protein type zinc-binding domain-containing protein n=1 Tax=Asparagus officinalis TaxID=4686 RepID=A0A5P1FP12_ASPOF|nr:uncharacterized protein A4U43_C02F21620 [Asparagus officinalis]